MSKTQASFPRVLLHEPLQTSYSRRVIAGIAAYAREHGPWALCVATDEEAASILKTWRPDGVITRGTRSRALLRLLARPGLAVAKHDWFWPGPVSPGVTTDNVDVGRMAAGHLLERGYRRLGFYAADSHLALMRLEGFAQVIAEAGGSLSVPTMRPTSARSWSLRSRINDVARWLVKLRPPVGILVTEDGLGFRVAQACEQLGLRIPDDVALIGVGNNEVSCQLVWPHMSSVQHDEERIGRETAGLLDALMHGRRVPRGPIVTPPLRVVTRGSTDAMAVDDPELAPVVRFLREHFTEPIALDDVLAHAAMSRRSLERRFRASLGTSVRAQLGRLRIERVKQLLVDTDVKITGIAAQSGFSSPHDMWVLFRRHTGMSPQGYRRRYRG